MTWQEPTQTNGKKAAAFGIGGLVALFASCGVGMAMGGDDTPAAAPTVTATVTDVATETETPTTTTEADDVDDDDVDDATDTVDAEPTAPVRLVPTTTEEIAPTAQSVDAYYPNCAAARAAGVAPLYAGSPGYSSSLDRDGDGVACE